MRLALLKAVPRVAPVTIVVGLVERIQIAFIGSVIQTIRKAGFYPTVRLKVRPHTTSSSSILLSRSRQAAFQCRLGLTDTLRIGCPARAAANYLPPSISPVCPRSFAAAACPSPTHIKVTLKVTLLVYQWHIFQRGKSGINIKVTFPSMERHADQARNWQIPHSGGMATRWAKNIDFYLAGNRNAS
jgi:hypothetical protein